MKTITLTKKQYEKLKPYYIDDDVFNWEADFYVLDHGKWQYSRGNYLLKRLHITKNESIANKLATVSLLSDKEQQIGIEELVIPKHLVSVEDEIVGFTVPKINNTYNLGSILNDSKVDTSKKIEYLKKLGKLIEKAHNISCLDFSFGDLHAYNFLIDKNNENLYAVDLDSSYINTNYPLPSYYLFNTKDIGLFPNKYKSNEIGINYPDKNSDLLCYNFIILSMLSKENISKLRLEEYFDYVNYLESIGYGENIIKSFRNIYSNADNINPYMYLDEIPKEYGKSLYTSYKSK